MADRQKIEAAVRSLLELGTQQLEEGNENEAKETFLNALNIAVRNIKLGQDEVEPLVELINKLIERGS